MTILTPGQGQPNPLLVLAAAFDSMASKLCMKLDKIADNTRAKHIYAVTQVQEGWAIYCLACSDELLRYTYPCRFHDPDKPLPPAGFSVDPSSL